MKTRIYAAPAPKGLICQWLYCFMLCYGYIQVLLDGPYGTPTRDIFETEHAVLVASGIGVTPFASILQSIMSRYRTAKHCCPNCNHAWYGDVPHTLMKLKKVCNEITSLLLQSHVVKTSMYDHEWLNVLTPPSSEFGSLYVFDIAKLVAYAVFCHQVNDIIIHQIHYPSTSVS